MRIILLFWPFVHGERSVSDSTTKDRRNYSPWQAGVTQLKPIWIVSP